MHTKIFVQEIVLLTEKLLKQVVVKESSDLRTVMESLKSTGLGIVVVVDNSNHVVGVATDGDVREILLKKESLDELVTSCMSRQFTYVDEGCSKENVLKLLDTRIHEIPVIDSSGCLVDVVGSGYNPKGLQSISRARTPARVSLAGGGTDFTEFFMDNGGAGLSCTIQKYSHAVLRKRQDKEIRIYSHDFRQSVRLEHIDDIEYNGKLDLIKAGIRLLKPEFGFELEIGCDFSPASGLGGSASLLSSVMACFNEFREHRLDRYAIAEYAFEAERIELDISGGWQDQYSTVFGGFNYLEFDRTHNTVMPLRLEAQYIQEIEERLILCFTNQSHLGEKIQKDNCNKNNKVHKKKHYSERLKEITNEMKRSLLRSDFDNFGKLLEETWTIKKTLDPRVTNSKLDIIHKTALDSGATGGRLLGTGGGGYFLFYVPPFSRYTVMESLEEIGCYPEAVRIDQNGVSSWKI